MNEGMKESSTPAWMAGRMAVMAERFPIFLGIALGFGILYTICMYRNPYGITYPVMISCAYGVVYGMFSMLSVKVKRNSLFLAAVALLLAISVCRTADMILIQMSMAAEFLLLMIFMIHQFYEDKSWSIGKYLTAMGIYFCDSIAAVVNPFCQGRYFFKKMNIGKYRTAVCVMTGLMAAVPIVFIAGVLLGQADAVFGAMVSNWIETFFHIQTILMIVCMIVFGTLGMYCLVGGACAGNISQDEKAVRTREPISAITAMTAVTLLYLFFCGIQVVYLFLGRGSLPDGMTYASYARQGFFQLLFVAVMNLVMVLLNLKYFKKNGLLNGILTVICVCTFVMIASASYRMILYVREYHLTYLRVLVLWFLPLLACLMAGVVVLIYKNEFPLFGWCLAVISVFYVGLAFGKPDRMVAEYNVAHVTEWSQSDFEYMTRELSADAVPAVLEAVKDEAVLGRFYSGKKESFLSEYYRWAVKGPYQGKYQSIRNLNLSYEEAKTAFKKAGLEEED